MKWQSDWDLCSKNYSTYMTKDFMILIHHNRSLQSLIVRLMCQNLQRFTLVAPVLSFSLGLCCVWERNDTLIYSATLLQISLWNISEQRLSWKNVERALKLHGTFRWIRINSLSSWVHFNMCTWKMERIYPLTSAAKCVDSSLKAEAYC